VQNFVDHDVSVAARDFGCGSRTYNNHDGTDIRRTTSRRPQSRVCLASLFAPCRITPFAEPKRHGSKWIKTLAHDSAANSQVEVK
jgi:hypothetical protein